MKRILLALGLVALAAISAACSSASAQPAPSGPVADGPTVVAANMAFSPSTVEVKAGSNFTLHFDNRDGAPHNVAVYTDSSASEKISIGEIVTSAKADQVVPALEAGTYFFRCDVHTNMMGTIVAK
jgi:plastocyanin